MGVVCCESIKACQSLPVVTVKSGSRPQQLDCLEEAPPSPSTSISFAVSTSITNQDSLYSLTS